jgi:hypothetical protein
MQPQSPLEPCLLARVKGAVGGHSLAPASSESPVESLELALNEAGTAEQTSESVATGSASGPAGQCGPGSTEVHSASILRSLRLAGAHLA